MEGHNIPALTLPFNIAVSTTFVCMKMAGYGITINSPPVDTPAQETIEWDQVRVSACQIVCCHDRVGRRYASNDTNDNVDKIITVENYISSI